MICLGGNFFEVMLFGFAQLLGSIGLSLLPHLGSFQPSFL